MKFQIEKMTVENLPETMEVMEDAHKSVGKQEWFVADEEAYVKQVLEGKGFLVGAREEKAGNWQVFLWYFIQKHRIIWDNMQD